MDCPEGQHHHDDSWTTSSRATSSCWRCARRIPSTPAQKFGEARDAAVLRRGSSPMHASTQPTRWWLLKSPHIRAQLAHPPLAPGRAHLRCARLKAHLCARRALFAAALAHLFGSTRQALHRYA